MSLLFFFFSFLFSFNRILFTKFANFLSSRTFNPPCITNLINYIYSLNFNPWFANLNIAMAKPIASDDLVTYDDGTKATRAQMAKDVSAFLTWTAEPKMENRKSAGWAALGFLLIFTILAYMSYQSIWADKKH